MARKTEIIVHKIEIMKAGRRFGKLWITKVGLQWIPRNQSNCGTMSWKEFDQEMKKRI